MLALAAFADEAAPAQRLADALGVPLQAIEVRHFPDGESMPVVVAPAEPTTVIYRSLDHPNAKLVELLLAADAARRAGAKRLILVAPYLCYLRQDAVFAPGEPLSRDVIAPLIGARFDAVVTVQAHLHRTSDLAAALGAPACNLIPIEPLAAALPAYAGRPVVIGPDAESAPWVAGWANALGADAVTLSKLRRDDRHVSLAARAADLRGRAAVIIDDIASSGGTLAAAIELAKAAGAASIDIAVAHALMDAAATHRLYALGARAIVSTDSVRHPTNTAHLAPMLARAVKALAR